MDDIEKNVTIAAPIERVWAALTDPQVLGAWMDDSAVKVELKVGGKFKFFGGETTGKITELAPPNTLEYTWRQGEWKKEWADSAVRWELKSTGKKTLLHLMHRQFPNQHERDSHDEGWDTYWLGPMVAWLEASDG